MDKFKVGQLIEWTYEHQLQYIALITRIEARSLFVRVLIAYDRMWLDQVGMTSCHGKPNQYEVGDLKVI